MFDAPKPELRRIRRRQRQRQQLASGPNRQSGLCPQCDQPYCNGDFCIDTPAFVDVEPSFSGRIARQHTHAGRKELYVYESESESESEPDWDYVPPERDENESPEGIREKFENFRGEFMRRYRSTLEAAIPGLQVVRATNLKHHVIKGFMKTLLNNRMISSMTFHGTREGNIKSISSRGLLVPGGRGVRVVNGSSHGVGIYTGTRFDVSKGYCSAKKMFACAVVDGVGESFASRKGRSYQHRHKQSKDVKRDENYVVIFNESRVVPLFLLEWLSVPDNSRPEPQRPLKIMIKHKVQPIISPLTAEREVIAVKRKQTAKQRCKDRHQLRSRKWEL